jgi:hypothetical protein
VVHGRFICFFRRAADGGWLVTLLMNSHSRPVVEIPPAGGAPAPGSE